MLARRLWSGIPHLLPPPPIVKIRSCEFCGLSRDQGQRLETGRKSVRCSLKRSVFISTQSLEAQEATHDEDDGHFQQSPIASTSALSIEESLLPLSGTIVRKGTPPSDRSFLDLTRAERANLSRDTFDHSLQAVVEGRSTLTSGERWVTIMNMYIYTQKERQWELDTSQVVRVFEFGTRYLLSEKGERHTLERSGSGGISGPTEQRILEELSSSYLAIQRSSLEENENAAKLLGKHALIRLMASSTRQDEEHALSLYESARSLPLSVEYCTSSRIADRMLQILFERNSPHTIAFLRMMIRFRKRPSIKFMTQHTIQRRNVNAEESYQKARLLLDDICGQGPSAKDSLLDLHEERLQFLQEQEWQDLNPSLAFIRWLAFESNLGHASNSPSLPSHDILLLSAMELWEAIYINLVKPKRLTAPSLKMLDELVARAINLVEGVDLTTLEYPPDFVTKAASLCVRHLWPRGVIALFPELLRIISLEHFSPALSQNLYRLARSRNLACLNPFEKNFFTWRSFMLPCYSAMFKSAAREKEGNLEGAGFAIQLYLDWTADGLGFPPKLWSTLWEAVGNWNCTEEASRLIDDYERSGQGKITPWEASCILKASVKQGKPAKSVAMLQMLLLRVEPDNLGQRLQMEAYNAILRQLGASNNDYRAEMLSIFKDMIEVDQHLPQVNTWNSMISGHVLRSTVNEEDVNNAIATYDTMISSGVEPIATTFWLLVLGSTRAVQAHSSNTSTLNCALDFYNKAISKQFLLNGTVTADLIMNLANKARWEEAKGVSEMWWRLETQLFPNDDLPDSKQERERALMMSAGKRINEMERRGVAIDSA